MNESSEFDTLMKNYTNLSRKIDNLSENNVYFIQDTTKTPYVLPSTYGPSNPPTNSNWNNLNHWEKQVIFVVVALVVLSIVSLIVFIFIFEEDRPEDTAEVTVTLTPVEPPIIVRDSETFEITMTNGQCIGFLDSFDILQPGNCSSERFAGTWNYDKISKVVSSVSQDGSRRLCISNYEGNSDYYVYANNSHSPSDRVGCEGVEIKRDNNSGTGYIFSKQKDNSVACLNITNGFQFAWEIPCDSGNESVTLNFKNII
jgi:hypothetical protein